MPLRDIAYEEDYRSGQAKLVDEFFRPSIAQASTYWRAVGFFSSSALERFGAPLGDFLRRDGRIRLVTSVDLRPADMEIIAQGKAKADVCASRLEEIIETEFGEGIGEGTERLARLLELGRLEIKIALPRHGAGIYHEKIGLFFDEEDFVAFSGSANESRYAFEENRECIDVYTSWDAPKRAHRKREHFKELWEKKDDGVDLFDFPEAVKRKLIRKVEEQKAQRQKPPAPPKDASWKWRHQDEALSKFLEAERGILNMATGTGKTRTALKIVRRLVADGEIDTVIVATDGTDLLYQWRSELLSVRREIGFQLFSDFETYKEVQSFNLSPERSILLVSRSGSPQRDALASAMRALSPSQQSRTLLIHDEVHKLGSPGTRGRLAGLSEDFRYRLGLSATPEREYDAEGTAFILEHLGGEIFCFGLEDAIKRGILAPFNYFPLPYALTPDDRQRLRDVHKRKAARAAEGYPMSDQEVWTELARVYKTSEGKLPVFRQFIASRPDLLERCIVFVESIDYAQSVLEMVHRHRPDFHTYFSGEDAETLKRFAQGDLECLVTCHRVSEGIDIKSLTSVILFSSARARLETIQRMGRCLRTDPSNPDKIANVVDFVRASDPDATEPNTDELRSAWLTELSLLRQEEDNP